MSGARSWLALALTLVALASGRARALPAATWLVAIGNNVGDADDVGLLYAERDAKSLSEALWSEAGVAPWRTTLLLGEDAATVRRELLRVNKAIQDATRAGAPATGLVVFYSGHADAQALHLGSSTLAFDELRALVEIAPAGVRLLVVDACRSGRVTRVKGVVPTADFELGFEDQVEAEGLAIITSSAAGETSQESDRLRGSFFTHHLVNGLRGAADKNGDGRVTLGETYAYAYAQTLRSSGKTLELQHPTYQFDVKGRGELVLAAPGASGTTSGRLRLGAVATYLVLEQSESGPVAAEVTPATAGATLALPTGTYFVQERLATEYREYRVALGAGAVVDLARESYRAVGYDRLVRRRGGERAAVHGVLVAGGGRGSIVSGEAPSASLVLGWSLDLPWFSLGLRARASTVTTQAGSLATERRHDELALGLTLQRFVDWSWASASVGVLAEATLHHQAFSGARDAPSRLGAGAAVGVLVALEAPLVDGLALRLEGGPLTEVLARAASSDGVEGRAAVGTPLTWWLAGGLVWRL